MDEVKDDGTPIPAIAAETGEARDQRSVARSITWLRKSMAKLAFVAEDTDSEDPHWLRDRFTETVAGLSGIAMGMLVGYYLGLEHAPKVDFSSENQPVFDATAIKANLENKLNQCAQVPHILGRLTVPGALVESPDPTADIQNPLAVELTNEQGKSLFEYAFATTTQQPDGSYEVNHVLFYDQTQMTLHTDTQPLMIQETKLRCKTVVPNDANRAVDDFNKSLFVKATEDDGHEIVGPEYATGATTTPLRIGLITVNEPHPM